jgi:hypothetical protein
METHPTSDRALVLVIGVLMTAWCVFDAWAWGEFLTIGAVLVTHVLMPFSVPIYLLWSRGPRGL